MAKVGIVLNLVGALIIATAVSTLGTVVFDIDPGVLPDWAASLSTGVPR
jgi:hypothetical protein